MKCAFFTFVTYDFKICNDKILHLLSMYAELFIMRIKIHILGGCEQQNDIERCYSASNLYNSQFFSLSKRYMELLGNDNWLILSEYHGLIWQGAMLVPYSSRAMSTQEKTRRLDVNLNESNIEKLLLSMGVLNAEIINNALMQGKSALSSVTFILWVIHHFYVKPISCYRWLAPKPECQC